MNANPLPTQPTLDQLFAVIATQTEIAKSGLDLEGVMAKVVQRATTTTSATGGVVELEDDGEMVYRAVDGAAVSMFGFRLPKSNSFSGLCVQTGSALRCDDADTDPRVNRDVCRTLGIRSMIAVPLLHNNVPIGVLRVFSSQPCAFGEGDLRVLGLLSELIAAAMHHAAKHEADELFRMATRDGLTGLANRSLFLDRLRHAIVVAKRESCRLGVLMIDMDNLKTINHRNGQKAGDAAILEVAYRVASAARQSDTVARIGGDEFAVVLSKLPNRESALLAAQRISTCCGEGFTFEGEPIQIGASVGVAIYPDDGDLADMLLEIAEQQMQQNKRTNMSVRIP